MNFVNSWNPDCGFSANENQKLLQYHEDKGGLLFTEFNVTQGMPGKKRSLDAIRFPQLEKDSYQSAGNYEKLKELIQKYKVELIEVHKWGFYGFGQLIGKSYILEQQWNPHHFEKVLITMSSETYHPETKPDPVTRSVFDAFDIKVYVPNSD